MWGSLSCLWSCPTSAVRPCVSGAVPHVPGAVPNAPGAVPHVQSVPWCGAPCDRGRRPCVIHSSTFVAGCAECPRVSGAVPHASGAVPHVESVPHVCGAVPRASMPPRQSPRLLLVPLARCWRGRSRSRRRLWCWHTCWRVVGAAVDLSWGGARWPETREGGPLVLSHASYSEVGPVRETRPANKVQKQLST